MTMTQATQAVTKTSTSSRANSSQMRQRFSRSMSNSVVAAWPAVARSIPGPSAPRSEHPPGASHCLTLREWFQLLWRW